MEISIPTFYKFPFPFCVIIFHSTAATVLVASNLTNSTEEEPNVNTTLFHSCVGFGLPVPEITWQHNGRDVSTSMPHTNIRNDIILIGGQKFIRSTLILALCDVMANQELIGEYTCVVRNNMRTSQYTFNITVPSKLVIIIITCVTR